VRADRGLDRRRRRHFHRLSLLSLNSRYIIGVLKAVTRYTLNPEDDVIARSSPFTIACALISIMPATARAQTPALADANGIRNAALDYIEGWYEGDAARMRRALHPELAKRMVWTDPTTGRSRLDQQSALTLIESTEQGGGSRVPPAQRRTDVRILDVFGGAAVVRVDADGWVDYLNLAKWNGDWRIVNVLWELRPQVRESGQP
jgi:Putative lumazine-binding